MVGGDVGAVVGGASLEGAVVGVVGCEVEGSFDGCVLAGAEVGGDLPDLLRLPLPGDVLTAPALAVEAVDLSWRAA